MSRTFIAVMTAAVLVTALPSFALNHAPDSQVVSQPVAGASGGGGATLSVEPTAQPAAVPGERFASGQVVMTTPSEVVLHTAKGMREFAIAPQTDEATVPVEGETVTVGYVPERGTVRIAAAQSAVRSQAPIRMAEETAPAIEPPAQNGAQTAEPVESTPATPAASPAAAKVAHRRARLPKTASDRPLILVAGLLAVAAAGAVRLAFHA